MASLHTLHIRRYEPPDEDAVWDLHVSALSAAGAYDEEFAHRDTDLRRIEAAYLESGGEFLVGEYGGGKSESESEGEDEGEAGSAGDLVAMGAYQPHDERDDTAVLRRMRVSPDHHRRGFGTAILEALETRARDEGFERVVLDTTPRQEAAVAFYEARGYDLWRRETVALEEDGIGGTEGEGGSDSRTLEMLFYEKRLDE